MGSAMKNNHFADLGDTSLHLTNVPIGWYLLISTYAGLAVIVGDGYEARQFLFLTWSVVVFSLWVGAAVDSHSIKLFIMELSLITGLNFRQWPYSIKAAATATTRANKGRLFLGDTMTSRETERIHWPTVRGGRGERESCGTRRARPPVQCVLPTSIRRPPKRPRVREQL